jgi:hypothetical protein
VYPKTYYEQNKPRPESGHAFVLMPFADRHMVKDVKKVLILTQNMDDVPFDLRPFRCIVYEQSAAGLRLLRRTMTDVVREISKVSYRFAVKQNEQYRFPNKLFGSDRCFHDFEVTEVWVTTNAAKFYLKEYRHILGQPEEKRQENSYGIECGEEVPLADVPWKLVLEETNVDTARFRVIPV